ncbi:MAG TPA: VTT domain-containing protein [Agrococcus sp.]|nr:VTT domain-containing protein [Agrococcus sp.]
MDVINSFILEAVASPWLLLVMLAVATIDGFFPPVPSETVLVAAAAVAASTGDVATIALLCVAAAVGAIAGDNIAYAIGRAVGARRFRWMRGERATAAVDRAQRTLQRRGAPLILGARYIPIGRVAVNLTAGALRYPRRRYVPLTILAGASWAVYSAAIGVLAGHWLGEQPLLGAAIGVGVALILGLLVDRVAAARRRAEHPARQLADALERDSARLSA